MEAPERRKKRLMIRWTEGEHKQLLVLASKAELTPTDYVRTRTLDGKLAPKDSHAPSVERRMLAAAIGELADVGDVLAVIEEQARIGQRPYDHVLVPAVKRVIDASEAILRALGVQP